MNHLALNMVTKGLLNMSNITKGMVIIGYKIVIKKHGGGDYWSLPYGQPHEPLYKEYKNPNEFYKDLKNTDDIDYIEVEMTWDKEVNKIGKKIEGELIRKKIEAVILKETGKTIKVELIMEE